MDIPRKAKPQVPMVGEVRVNPAQYAPPRIPFLQEFVPPELRESLGRIPEAALAVSDFVGVPADIKDMKHYSGATMDSLRDRNYSDALANTLMTGAALGMTALPGSVGGIDKAVKKLDEPLSFMDQKKLEAANPPLGQPKPGELPTVVSTMYDDVPFIFRQPDGTYADNIDPDLVDGTWKWDDILKDPDIESVQYTPDDVMGATRRKAEQDQTQAVLDDFLDPTEHTPGHYPEDVKAQRALNAQRRRSEIGLISEPLPMDTPARMKRAEEMGNTVDAYHGSPRDIKEFNSSLYGTPEGHYGANAYFTSSVDDVNANYSGEGPDLTNRIQRTMEQSADEPDDYNILEYWTDRDLDVDDIADLTDGQIEEAQEGLARQYLGVENQGTVYPVKLRMENPVVVGGKNETFFDFNMELDDAGEYVGESGQAIELIETTKQTLKGWGASDYDIDDVMTKISEQLEDGISAGEYEDIMRSNVNELYDDVSGEMASPGAVIADVYKSMGFDSIDMDAYQAFNERRGFGGAKMGGMSGVYPDTRHYITLSDSQARSRFAKFDPAKKDSANLLAGVAGGGLAVNLGLAQRDNKTQ